MKLSHFARIATISTVALTLCAGSALAQQKPLKEMILGSWLVVKSLDKYEDGHTNVAFEAGALTFDNTGHFTQILLGKTDPAMKSPDPRKPDSLTIAYVGTYTVSDDKTIKTHVDLASNSIRKGADQTFTVTSSGETLNLTGSSRTDQIGKFTPNIELKRAK